MEVAISLNKLEGSWSGPAFSDEFARGLISGTRQALILRGKFSRGSRPRQLGSLRANPTFEKKGNTRHRMLPGLPTTSLHFDGA